MHTQLYDPGDVGGDVDGEALVVNEFSDENGVTTQTMLVVYRSKEDRDAAFSTGMTDGMEMSR